MASNMGLQRSKASRSPPTITASRPVSAPKTPPETGASSTTMPRSAPAAATFRIAVGDGIDLRWPGQRGEHNIARLGQLGRALGPAGAAALQLLGGSASRVVDG